MRLEAAGLTQVLVLALFVWLGVVAVKGFRAGRSVL